MNKQQTEALLYFKKHASEWKLKASGGDDHKVNVIRQRNDYVIHVVKNRNKTSFALDVGCGTGDLVIELGRLGISCIGVDFAEEMIREARTKAQSERIDIVSFECSSIFDFSCAPSTYDVISANGFIEYVSLSDLEKFCLIAREALRPGGSLVISSRNRLFNLFSLNAYTEYEIRTNSLVPLLNEAILLGTGVGTSDLMNVDTPKYQPQDMRHADTGIAVSTRFQYTPAQLIKLLAGYGFNPVALSPVHIHALSTVLIRENPEIHGLISNMLQEYGMGKMQFIPFSSSFMLHAVRK